MADFRLPIEQELRSPLQIGNRQSAIGNRKSLHGTIHGNTRAWSHTSTPTSTASATLCQKT
jgi:hypothetical protein